MTYLCIECDRPLQVVRDDDITILRCDHCCRAVGYNRRQLAGPHPGQLDIGDVVAA